MLFVVLSLMGYSRYRQRVLQKIISIYFLSLVHYVLLYYWLF